MAHPFHAHTGLTIESAANGAARLRMKWKSEHTQDQGVLQGGYLAMIADAAVHTAADTLSKPGEILTTIELKTNFLGSARAGEWIVGEAVPAHLGRTTQVWDVTVTNETTDRTIALQRCTQMVLYPTP